jgi:cation diffusion facilitator family transporter
MKRRTYEATRVTWAGLFVNIALAIAKLFAGMIGRSAAMIADAFHSLSDFGTDIVILFSFRIIDKPVDKSHDYGHGKVETLTSVIIGVVLLVVGVKVCWSGCYRIFRFYQGQLIPRPGLIAFYAAVISIISKEWLYHYTVKVGKVINS